MIGFDNLPALLAHTSNSWEREPLLYARAQGIKTKRIKIKKEKEGYIGGKTRYAEDVTLTVFEYEKLKTRYGETNRRRMIEKLSVAKGAKGYKYKSDYKAILNWVAAAVLGTKSAAVPEPTSTGSPHPLCDVPGCGKVCDREHGYMACPDHGRREIL
jgi:hypothetical protein